MRAFHARGFNYHKGLPLPTIDSARIGAENRCLKIANAVGRRDGRRREENRTGTQLVRGLAVRCSSLYLREVKEVSVRSIIGATEKRRESGTDAAVIGDMGGSGLVRLVGGVYQDWGGRGEGVSLRLSTELLLVMTDQ